MANSPSGGDVANFATLTGSHNLIQDGSGGLADTIVADPKLGPLANNGGPTQTMALLTGSPAIDAGSNALANAAGLTTDQRGPGFPRIVNSTVDIGAFEYSLQPTFASLSSATTTYGTPTITLTGTLAAGATAATGNVTVTISGNGITALSQSASLDPNGNFTAMFNTAALPANPSSPYTVTYDYAGQDYFLAASDASTTLTVNAAPLTVTAGNESMTYGGTVPALTYTYTGLVNGDPSATFTGGLATTATSSSSVGGYAITQGTLAATGNYTIGTFNAGTLTVNAALLTITPTAGQSKGYGAALPALTYTASGFVNGDPATLLTGALGTTAASASAVGNYAFTLGTLAAGGNYTLALAANPPTFAVTPATLTVSANAQTKVYGSADPTLTYAVSGFQLSDTAATVLSGALTRPRRDGGG